MINFVSVFAGLPKGHSRSTIVDLTYAHALHSGMAAVASSAETRVYGEPALRVIEGGKSGDLGQSSDDAPSEPFQAAVSP